MRTSQRLGLLFLLLLSFFLPSAARAEGPPRIVAATVATGARPAPSVRPPLAPRAAPSVVKATGGTGLVQEIAPHVPALRPITEAHKASCVDIMLKGSLNVSRTKVDARRFMAPRDVADEDVSDIAEKNFHVAASYLLDHVDAPLDLVTATKLNKMLTVGLVPKDVLGKTDFRRDPKPFYAWLASPEAEELGRTDPVALAERVHHEVGLLDAFPDGNGRTSRLLADLVLLKAGHAPALYTDIKDYFAHGAPRATVSRAEHLAYFRKIVARGDVELAQQQPPRVLHVSTSREKQAAAQLAP